MDSLLDWIGRLEVTQGALAGQRFEVQRWQEEWIRGVFQPGISEGVATIARANGKSTLAASLASAAVYRGGPLVEPRAETVLVASSARQAEIVFNHVLAFGGRDVRKRYRVLRSNTATLIEDEETGACVRAISSDPDRAHGLAARMFILDEIAKWPPTTTEPMIAALRTAAGKIPDSKMLWIGTRPADAGHPFSRMLDNDLPGVYRAVYSAPQDAALDDEAAWAQANPSMEFFPDLKAAIRREAQLALADPALQPSFRAYRLNSGIADTIEAVLLTAESWKRAEGDVPAEGQPVLGLDVGATVSMSAAAAFWPQTGRLDAFAAFPSRPSLAERAARDGAGDLYQRMADEGRLLQLGDRTVDVHAVLEEALDRWGRPQAVAADRFREAELRQALDAIRFPPTAIRLRGMGFKDGSTDLKLFRRACLDGRCRPVRSTLLRASLAAARAISDPAGNQKLARSTQAGRRSSAKDDAIAASILAVSVGIAGKHRSGPLRWAAV